MWERGWWRWVVGRREGGSSAESLRTKERETRTQTKNQIPFQAVDQDSCGEPVEPWMLQLVVMASVAAEKQRRKQEKIPYATESKYKIMHSKVQRPQIRRFFEARGWWRTLERWKSRFGTIVESGNDISFREKKFPQSAEEHWVMAAVKRREIPGERDIKHRRELAMMNKMAVVSACLRQKSA